MRAHKPVRVLVDRQRKSVRALRTTLKELEAPPELASRVYESLYVKLGNALVVSADLKAGDELSAQSPKPGVIVLRRRR